MLSGTKEQLQAYGLGVGLTFPGEPGGPRREMRVKDPRGFPVRISQWTRDLFLASVYFPDWPKAPPSMPPCEPSRFDGVTMRRFIWTDDYVGTAEALAVAGLARPEHLPGAPGMGKVQVTILPDETPRDPKKRLEISRYPWLRRIERISARTYRVCVRVEPDESKRRQAADRAAHDAWELRVRRLQRPPRLQPIPERVAQFNAAASTAARDVRFQGMLGRIVSETTRDPLPPLGAG